MKSFGIDLPDAIGVRELDLRVGGSAHRTFSTVPWRKEKIEPINHLFGSISINTEGYYLNRYRYNGIVLLVDYGSEEHHY